MKSLEDLRVIKEKAKQNIGLRHDKASVKVLVGMGTCGILAGARPVITTIVEEVAKNQIDNIMVTQMGCIGMCQYEPIVEIIGENGIKTTYVNMTPEKALKVVSNHLLNGNIVTEYTIGSAEN